MYWTISHCCDDDVRPLADTHYNRQKIGSKRFVPPGRCLVLKFFEKGRIKAFWATSWPYAKYVHHAWAGAWVCSAFKNVSSIRSSDLIREAVAATRWYFGAAPSLGMITFVDPKLTQEKELPGWCYRRAKFKRAKCPKHRVEGRRCMACRGMTGAYLHALQLLENRMPPAEAPLGAEIRHPDYRQPPRANDANATGKVRNRSGNAAGA